MSERRKLPVRAWSGYPPEGLAEVIAFLQEQLAAIPDAERPTAELTVSIDPDCSEWEIIYERPETDEEQAQREIVERLHAQRAEARERANYLFLKRKFERQMG